MVNPYRLPDAPVAIQFSGGRTSGYMLWHILDAHDGQLPPDAHVLFQNTGREMPETLDFVRECGAQWNVPIVWLEYRDTDPGWEIVNHNSASRDGEPFAALIRKRNYLPNRVARFCTSELKVKPSKAFMRSYGYDHWTAAVGFRADEQRRALKPDDPSQPWVTWPPLYHAGVTKRDVLQFWSKMPFDLELPSVKGATPLGNCDGCFLKSEKNRAWLARYRPDRAMWWADMEAEIAGRFQSELSWDQMIADAQRQLDWVFAEESDHYCDATLGACLD